jgi:hypothetical protein
MASSVSSDLHVQLGYFHASSNMLLFQSVDALFIPLLLFCPGHQIEALLIKHTAYTVAIQLVALRITCAQACPKPRVPGEED